MTLPLPLHRPVAASVAAAAVVFSIAKSQRWTWSPRFPPGIGSPRPRACSGGRPAVCRRRKDQRRHHSSSSNAGSHFAYDPSFVDRSWRVPATPSLSPAVAEPLLRPPRKPASSRRRPLLCSARAEEFARSRTVNARSIASSPNRKAAPAPRLGLFERRRSSSFGQI